MLLPNTSRLSCLQVEYTAPFPGSYPQRTHQPDGCGPQGACSKANNGPLSHPEGASVNDGIRCSLRHTSVEIVAVAAKRLGVGALLAKINTKSAYCLVPAHPLDPPLLGVQCGRANYVDGALPFGLRSAPKLFTAADALQCVMVDKGGIGCRSLP